MLNGSSDVSGLACTSRDLGLLLWTAKMHLRFSATRPTGRTPPVAQTLRRSNGLCRQSLPSPRACQHSSMGQVLTRVPCPECGTSGDSDPEQSHWQCSNCGNGFFLRRCTACSRVSYVDGLQGFHTPWPCTWCGRYNQGFSQNQDPAAASAAELAAEVHRYGRPGSPAGPDTGGRDRTPAHDTGRGPGQSGRTIAAARPGPHPDPGHLALRAETRRPCWCGRHGRGCRYASSPLGGAGSWRKQ